jgi:hypothetical protein
MKLLCHFLTITVVGLAFSPGLMAQRSPVAEPSSKNATRFPARFDRWREGVHSGRRPGGQVGRVGRGKSSGFRDGSGRHDPGEVSHISIIATQPLKTIAI